LINRKIVSILDKFSITICLPFTKTVFKYHKLKQIIKMKSLRNLSIIAILILFSITSCIKPTLVYVQSGKIFSDTTFVKSEQFSASDSAIGKIDFCDLIKANGFKTSDGKVYVFEKKIPKKLLAKPFKIEKRLKKAIWQKDEFIYKLKFDALICEDPDNYSYFSRKAGAIYRDSCTIFGEKVYSFIDTVYKENYANLLDFSYRYRHNSINLFTELGINNLSHTMTSERLKIDSLNGTILFGPGLNVENTKDGTFDKIIFKPKGSGQTHLVRVILKNHSQMILNNNFLIDNATKKGIEPSKDGCWRAVNKEAWKTYLDSTVYPKIKWPKFVRGYDCSICQVKNLFEKNSLNNLMPVAPTNGGGELRPPLPIVANQ
jgi:hypothetical protein